MPSIAFQMSCYEKSYNHVLKNGIFRHNLSLFQDINFEEKTIIVNNVSNYDNINSLIKDFSDIYFIFADEKPEITLDFFNLSLADFPIGLYYSLQHFTGIHYTQCDYLFHISEDCGIDNLDSKFIEESIDMLESNEKYIIAMPRWCKDDNAIEKAEQGNDKFFVQYGFTDQIYIIKTKKFKEDIYHYNHPMSDRYPKYGGECFEKKIDSFMRCNKYYGVVHKNYIYDSKYYDAIIKKEI